MRWSSLVLGFSSDCRHSFLACRTSLYLKCYDVRSISCHRRVNTSYRALNTVKAVFVVYYCIERFAHTANSRQWKTPWHLMSATLCMQIWIYRHSHPDPSWTSQSVHLLSSTSDPLFSTNTVKLHLYHICQARNRGELHKIVRAKLEIDISPCVR